MGDQAKTRAGQGNIGVEVIARGLLQYGSKLLLCRSKVGGYSYLPGGHVESDETAAEACRREFLEETGMPVRVGNCLLVCEVLFDQKGTPRHEINLVFHVEHSEQNQLTEDEIRSTAMSKEEHIAFDWVEFASLADINLRPSAIRAWLVSGGEVADGQSPHWFSVNERS